MYLHEQNTDASRDFLKIGIDFGYWGGREVVSGKQPAIVLQEKKCMVVFGVPLAVMFHVGLPLKT
jgi:hypothetical protein